MNAASWQHRFVCGWRVLVRNRVFKLAQSALFVASVVHLLHPGLLPLEMPARLLISHDAASSETAQAPATKELAVLKLDRHTFRDRDAYQGRQPLDRCRLRTDLKQLIDRLPGMQVLGIDVDLSDTGDPEDDQCGLAILEDLRLAQEQRAMRVVLILPVDEQDRRTSQPWRLRVKAAGLTLADPRLVREMGMTRRHWIAPDRCPGLGVALTPLVNWGPLKDALSTCFAPEERLGALDEGKEHNISFHRLVRRLWIAEPGTVGPLRLHDQIEQLANAGGATRVLFGADFDQSDEFLTPLGMLSGVEVHAAIALNPTETLFSHLGALGLDVVLGIGFGWLVHAVWGRYFLQRLGQDQPAGRDAVRLAYLWPVGLLLLWALLAVVALPLFSHWVLLTHDMWINPVPMLIGMSLDAFTVGSVQAALHHGEHRAAHAAALAPAHGVATAAPVQPKRLRRPYWQRWYVIEPLARLPLLVWFGVVAWALHDVLAH